MRKAFVGLAALLMLAVLVQIFLAGSGAFDTAPNDEAFGLHRTLGYATVLLTAVMALVAALARLPGRLIGMSGLVTGLGILQPVISMIAKAFGDPGDTTTTAGQLVFGLHAVNGLIMVYLARLILQQARERTDTAHTTRAAAGDGSLAAEPAAGSTRSAS